MRSTESSKPWKPILEGASKNMALEAVSDIADRLSEPPPAMVPEDAPRSRRIDENASLSGGQAGVAVLYGYLHQTWPERGYDRIGTKILARAVRTIAEEKMSASLYGGFAGVAWAVAHLQGRLLDPNEEDPNRAIDDALRDYLGRSPWREQFDVITGLVGYGIYALERLPRKCAAECLTRVIAQLDAVAEVTPEGVTWFTPPELLPPRVRTEYPRGYYNLGVAHGTPGVISFLGRVCAAGMGGRKARRLLDGAVAWLLAQQHENRPSGARFPYYVTPAGETPRAKAVDESDPPARSAWCYGDPGIAAALLCAARSVGESAWEQEAIQIGLGAAMRSVDEAGVKDAGFCHGACGLGHIYNRMFQATGDARFLQAARLWFERTLDMRRPGEGLAGFSALAPLRGGEEALWREDPGILTGVAGIALSLLAATTSLEPAWDRFLLVPVPTMDMGWPRADQRREEI